MSFPESDRHEALAIPLATRGPQDATGAADADVADAAGPVSAAGAGATATEEGAEGDWQRTSPLAVLFYFGRGVKAVVGNLATSIGSVATLVTLGQESIWYAVLGAVCAMALLAAIAFARYWRFRFRFDRLGVRLREGVFKRKETDLQFDRIQGVNVEQSMLYRRLGLATVSFDTAGSAQQEGHLPAVTRQFADALRMRVERRRHPSLGDEDAPPQRPPALLRLGNADVLRVGLTDPTVLIGLAATPALLQLRDDPVWDAAERTADQAAAELAGMAPLVLGALVAGALLAVLAVVLGATLVAAFLRFHDYTLWLEGGAFRSRAGLLTRKEVVMAVGKIQQLRLTQSWALRCFGRYRLRASPASRVGGHGEGGELTGTQTLQVPILSSDTALGLRQRMLPGEGDGLALLPRDERFAPVSRRYIQARVMALGALPALLGGAAAALLDNAAAAPFVDFAAGFGAAWIALVAALAWQSWRRRAYMYDAEGLAYRSGLFGFKVDIFLFRKVQCVRIHQSPLQRRHGLATLYVHLASGLVSIPFIDSATASRLRDYMLYRAESSQRPWH